MNHTLTNLPVPARRLLGVLLLLLPLLARAQSPELIHKIYIQHV
jgi:hypothetical protein